MGTAMEKVLRDQLYKQLQEQHEELKRAHETLRHDLKVGARIHETLLLGKIPENIPGIDIQTLSIPSREIEGDFFEFYKPTHDVLDVVIGDVMGKGLPAALVGTAVKTQLMRFAVPFMHVHIYEESTRWLDDLLSPKEILEHVHSEISKQLIDLEYFCSLFYGRFNLHKQSLTYVDCGSTKPVHYSHSQKKANPLMGPGFPLGTVEKHKYREIEIPYESGDFFIFYSDGVTEARSSSSELFGFERVAEIAEENPDIDSISLISILKDALIQFAQRTSFEDDITIIIVKFSEQHLHNFFKLKTTKFKVDPGEIDSIRSFVNQVCREMPHYNEEFNRLLQLAINEAFCNIVKHGYKELQGDDVIIQSEVTEDGIAFIISDQGHSFDPTKIPEPDLTGNQDHGFGWHFIKMIADQVTYVHKESQSGWNHLRIYKKYEKHSEEVRRT